MVGVPGVLPHICEFSRQKGVQDTAGGGEDVVLEERESICLSQRHPLHLRSLVFRLFPRRVLLFFPSTKRCPPAPSRPNVAPTPPPLPPPPRRATSPLTDCRLTTIPRYLCCSLSEPGSSTVDVERVSLRMGVYPVPGGR